MATSGISRAVQALIAVYAVAGGLALAAKRDEPIAPVKASVIDTGGKEIGTVTLEQTASGVLIIADVRELPPGGHGFHFHEKGLCENADGFKSAGAHYAPRAKSHGIRMVGGHHAGDMPNQFAGHDGVLNAHVINSAVTLAAKKPNSLADADGTALVIHADPDDYASQPAGAAGARIACAVISPPRASLAAKP